MFLSKKNALFSLLVLQTSVALPQSGTLPYSYLSFGQPLHTSSAVANGMGGVFSSHYDPFAISVTNPALLANNRFTVLDVGIFAEQKTLQDASNKGQAQGGGLNHVMMSFPIATKKRNMTASVGLQGYSRANYFYEFSEYLPGTQEFAEYSFSGSGGINKIPIGWSYKPISVSGLKTNKDGTVSADSAFKRQQYLSIGVFSDIFLGRIFTNSTSNLDLPGTVFRAEYIRSRTHGGLGITPGINYQIRLTNPTYTELKEKQDKPLFLNIGIAYTPAYTIGGTEINRIDLVNRVGDKEFYTFIDTLENESFRLNMPSTLRLGVSVQMRQKWLVAIDYSQTQWASFKDSHRASTLYNTYEIAMGAEFSPGYTSDQAFKRTTFRFGGYMRSLPMMLSNIQPKDLGINFGLSIPTGSKSAFVNPSSLKSSIGQVNVAFVYGSRGTLRENLVRENYFSIYMGMTLTEKWFVRRKIY